MPVGNCTGLDLCELNDPNEFCESISVLDNAVHEAMLALIEGKGTETAWKIIDAAFEGLPTPYITFCVKETLLYWYVNSKEDKTDEES